MLIKMPDNEYFARPEMSQSFLKDFEISPAHAMIGKKKTSSMNIGTQFHSYLLEPEEFKSRFHIMEKMSRATKVYKDYVKENGLSDDDIIFDDSFDSIIRMAENVKNTYLDGVKISKILEDSENELAGFFSIETAAGIEISCKMKIDILLRNRKIIIDIKTTGELAKFFDKKASNYKYYFQDPFYRIGLSKILGCNMSDVDFYFVVVETAPPHGVIVYKLDTDYFNYGFKKVITLVDKYSKWNGSEDLYQSGTIILKKPGWLND